MNPGTCGGADGTRTRNFYDRPPLFPAEYYPTPRLREKKIAAGGERYQTPEWVLDGWPKEANDIAVQIYENFNKEHATAYEFELK